MTGPQSTAGIGSTVGEDVAVVIVHYRGIALTLGALADVPAGIPVVVVDNSGDAARLRPAVLARPGAVLVESGANLGFGRGVNLGARHTHASLLLLLNPDAVLSAAALRELTRTLRESPGVAAVGPALADRDGHLHRDGGGWLPSISRALAHAVLGPAAGDRGIWALPSRPEPMEVEWLTGACLLLRRDAFDAVGGFDEAYPLYNEDMDLGARLRGQGWRLVLDARVRVVHGRGASADGAAAVADGQSPSPAASLDPSWLWRIRGQAMGFYLQRHHGRRGTVIAAVLAGGYLLRAAGALLTGRRSRVPEMLTYARSVLRSTAPQLP